MNSLSRRISTIAAGAALTMAVAGGVMAGTQSSDEQALALLTHMKMPFRKN